MRTYAVARTSAQWADIAEAIHDLLADSAARYPHVELLAADLLDMLRLDDGASITLPQGVFGDRDLSGQDADFATRFPYRTGVDSTHYVGCWHGHPECAWRAGFSDAQRRFLDAPPSR